MVASDLLINNRSKSTGRNIGQSASNVSQKARAIEIFNAIGKKVGYPPFSKLTAQALAGDNMKELFRLFAIGLAGGIPHHADENLESEKSKMLTLQTTKQYWSMVNTKLKEKFPDHNCFPCKKGDNAEWYKELEASMTKEFQRNEQDWINNPNYKVGNAKTFALLLDPMPRMDLEERCDLSC